MKELSKETKREVVDKYTVYVATDGTEFVDKLDCLEYEKSALCALYTMLMSKGCMRKLDTKMCYQLIDNFLDEGFNRCEYYSVSIRTDEELKLFLQMIELYRSKWCIFGDSKYLDEHPEIVCATMKASEFKVKEDYIFCVCSDGEFIMSFNKKEYIKRLTASWNKILAE